MDDALEYEMGVGQDPGHYDQDCQGIGKEYPPGMPYPEYGLVYLPSGYEYAPDDQDYEQRYYEYRSQGIEELAVSIDGRGEQFG